jgi:hypothetical protein
MTADGAHSCHCGFKLKYTDGDTCVPCAPVQARVSRGYSYHRSVITRVHYGLPLMSSYSGWKSITVGTNGFSGWGVILNAETPYRPGTL